MLLRFHGGPWDGVEFEAPAVHPLHIDFTDLDIRTEKTGGSPAGFEIHQKVRAHHRYLWDMTEFTEDADVMNYRYAPGETHELLS